MIINNEWLAYVWQHYHILEFPGSTGGHCGHNHCGQEDSVPCAGSGRNATAQ